MSLDCCNLTVVFVCNAIVVFCILFNSEIGNFAYTDYMGDADFDQDVRAARHCCLPWRAPCTLDESLVRKYSFLQCCNNGACR
ncbi:unnamed protein product [Candidula unifasciata]|uniref:Uncharacterized protein n=1 Tax=Candidula unifasciata TaxID=100452 RepID=A0A8S3ZFS4_9EUPU|nr:unnamed protein product [Candidula unifasciata]